MYVRETLSPCSAPGSTRYLGRRLNTSGTRLLWLAVARSVILDPSSFLPSRLGNRGEISVFAAQERLWHLPRYLPTYAELLPFVTEYRVLPACQSLKLMLSRRLAPHGQLPRYLGSQTGTVTCTLHIRRYGRTKRKAGRSETPAAGNRRVPHVV